MKAILKNYRQSPRKVRSVGDLIKGKSVANAKTELSALPKRAAFPIQTLLDSAVANAKANNGITNADNLVVQNVTVNKGLVMKRFIPRARGSASRINKRTSHVTLTLTEKVVEKKAKPALKVKKAKAEKVK
jgi:large subunit ribosomal protein L22